MRINFTLTFGFYLERKKKGLFRRSTDVQNNQKDVKVTWYSLSLLPKFIPTVCSSLALMECDLLLLH